ncbi:unnamed protein product [Durusdinium trenchii]|uniref:SET domain-containing protein 5 n=2 Tax=Durusdinium trenchii TaxID=1381693 RepID=A0ABP0Q2N1_9DINO
MARSRGQRQRLCFLGAAFACAGSLCWTKFPGFHVVPIEGKGLGAVAEQNFQAGDLVYEESPRIMWDAEDAARVQLLKLVAAILLLVSIFLFVAFNSVGLVPLPLAAAVALGRPEEVPEEVKDQWNQLSQEQKDQLKGLSDASTEKSMMGILRTNGFSRGASKSSSSLLLCPVLARFNHSCSPNCQQSWDEQSGTEKLYAMTTIQKGEELCITYCDLREPREVRRETLQAKYGFRCACVACDVASAVAEASDARRGEAARLQEMLPSADAAEGVQIAKRILQLLDEEGIADLTLRGLACSEAVRHCQRLGDLQRAQSWAKQAYIFYSQARGPESQIARRAKEYLDALDSPEVTATSSG